MGLREDQAALTRRRLLDAFDQLSAGPDAKPPAMADVARRAGVSPATMYRHFPNRDALVHAAATAGVNLGVDPPADWSLDHMADHLRAQWAEFSRNRVVAREGALSEAGRELRAARFTVIRRALAAGMREAGAPRSAATRRCVATLALLASVHTFLELADRQGLDVDEAVATAMWAMRACLTAAGVDPGAFLLTD